MKRVLVVGLAIAILSGCAPTPQPRPKTPYKAGENGAVIVDRLMDGYDSANVSVTRVRDKELGVVCYMISGSGTSCMLDPSAEVNDIASDSDWTTLSQEETTALLDRVQ